MTSEPVPVTREGLERLREELETCEKCGAPRLPRSWQKRDRTATSAKTRPTMPRVTTR